MGNPLDANNEPTTTIHYKAAEPGCLDLGQEFLQFGGANSQRQRIGVRVGKRGQAPFVRSTPAASRKAGQQNELNGLAPSWERWRCATAWNKQCRTGGRHCFCEAVAHA